MKSRSEWIDEYYEQYFDNLCNSGVQGRGSIYIHQQIEKYWRSTGPRKILEVGVGDGAHFKFTKFMENATVELTALDVRPPKKCSANWSWGVDCFPLTGLLVV